ncbi:Zinc ABC transporter, periplasmic-binding protein ZnuA, partial [hydrothermal vent metagenome]
MNTNTVMLAIVVSLAFYGSSHAGEGHDHSEKERVTLMSQEGHDSLSHDDHADHDDHSDHGGHGETGHDDHADHESHDETGHNETSHDDHSDHGGHDETGHDDHGHEEASSVAKLTAEQRAMAGIETVVVQKESLGQAITAPGEAKLNAYQTTKITPRTPSQVIERHVRLGDHVQKGQVLVTLSSMEMAEAQGELIEANSELRRVKRLGKKVVSGKRFVNAEIAYQLAY